MLMLPPSQRDANKAIGEGYQHRASAYQGKKKQCGCSVADFMEVGDKRYIQDDHNTNGDDGYSRPEHNEKFFLPTHGISLPFFALQAGLYWLSACTIASVNRVGQWVACATNAAAHVKD